MNYIGHYHSEKIRLLTRHGIRFVCTSLCVIRQMLSISKQTVIMNPYDFFYSRGSSHKSVFKVYIAKCQHKVRAIFTHDTRYLQRQKAPCAYVHFSARLASFIPNIQKKKSTNLDSIFCLNNLVFSFQLPSFEKSMKLWSHTWFRGYSR